MKRILWKVTLASLLTLVAYLALYMIWGAILSGVESQTLRLTLIALMTSVAYGAVLVYVSKIRGGVGEDEVMEDYRDGTYTSLAEDLQKLLLREAKTLLCMAVITIACCVVNTLDMALLGKKTVSGITLVYAPLCLFSSLSEKLWLAVPLYALGVVVAGAAYVVFLLIYRKKKYMYWMGNK